MQKFLVRFCVSHRERKKQIAFLNRPDIAEHKITSERPGERQNNFLTSAKTVGAKVGVERQRVLLCIASMLSRKL